MILAVPERQMGCSPLGRIISKLVKKCNGRKGWMRKEKLDYAMAYPQAQTCYARPTARTVTTTSHAISSAQPPQVYCPFAPAPPGAAGKPRKRRKSKSKNVRFNTGAGETVYGGSAPPPNVADAYQHASAAGSTSLDAAAYGNEHQRHLHAYSSPEPHGHRHGHGHGQGGYYGRYAPPSPLTRWEMLGAGGTPRRHEYFSGEYRWCYPTPVREGIYSMATDANRLTAIFSEENPNACTIV